MPLFIAHGVFLLVCYGSLSGYPAINFITPTREPESRAQSHPTRKFVGNPHGLTSFSKPGRNALKKALVIKLTTVCQVLVRGFSRGA